MTFSPQGANNTHACGCRDRAKQYNNTRSVTCRGDFGLLFVCSLSVVCQIVAVVRTRAHLLGVNIVLELCRMHLGHHTITLPYFLDS